MNVATMQFRIVAGLIATLPLCGQFSDLAPTDDGYQVYFATTLRLKTESSLRLPSTAAIYRISGTDVQRFTDPPQFIAAPTRPYHSNPNVSGGGEVMSYTTFVPCRGSGCLSQPTTTTSTVFESGVSRRLLNGLVQISRDGRYVVNAGVWSSPLATSDFRQITDLRTNSAAPISPRQALPYAR
jgi:hypothetical protein